MCQTNSLPFEVLCKCSAFAFAHRVLLLRLTLSENPSTFRGQVHTFQQVQKYERGANRIGASRLYDLSQVLDVPVSYFFDDMPEEVSDQSPGNLYAKDQDPEIYEVDASPFARRETLELVRCYYQIPDQETRRRILDLARSLAGAFGEQGE